MYQAKSGCKLSGLTQQRTWVPFSTLLRVSRLSKIGITGLTIVIRKTPLFTNRNPRDIPNISPNPLAPPTPKPESTRKPQLLMNLRLC